MKEHAIAEVMNLLEAELSSRAAGGVVDLTAPGPDIPALREQLASWCRQAKPKTPSGCS